MPRETLAIRRHRADEIVGRLRAANPDTRISLEYENEFQLLVAVILSAQCTDAMVNRVTKTLFQKYRTVDDFAQADRRAFQGEIRPTGNFRQKSKNIIAAARAVRERFGGRVPDSMEELTTLPGVGRKTANVVLWNAFGKREGIAVDTHVTRVSGLLRLTRSRDPKQIEQDLIKLVPQEAWGEFTHLMIDHGRAVCVAGRPRCERCVLNSLCPSALRPLEPSVLQAGLQATAAGRPRPE